QDREQALVYDDLIEIKQEPLEAAVANGSVVLAVCGGYQLLGHYYQTAEGERFPGIGLIDVRTEAGKKRFIGDVVVDTTLEDLKPTTLVGFENHSGRTFLGAGARALGRVRVGSGNNGGDAADRQHPPAQRDLASHRDVVSGGPAGEDRGHGGQDSESGRRPFLRLRTGRHVDVDVVLELRQFDADLAGVRLEVRERRRRRL